MNPRLSLQGRTEKNDIGLQNTHPEPLTLRVNDYVSLRLYRDTRPHCLETASLQKGLVLMRNSEEMVEEGMGFGAPVAIYRDEPYFSSTSQCSIREGTYGKTLLKTFVMDTVSRKKIGKAAYFNGGLYSLFHRIFHAFYTLNLPLTPVFNRFIASATIIGVSTEFVRVKPRGRVNIEYALQADSVLVEASFARLEKVGCDQIMLLNEQGAGFFTKYSDSNGQAFVGAKIGAWVPVNADQAALSDIGGKLGFSLKKLQNAVLFRGREAIRGRYSWVGLSYSLRPSNAAFKYTIKLKM